MRCKLKDLGIIFTGNTPSKTNKAFYDSEDIGFVKPDVLSDCKVTEEISTIEYISEKARSKARIVEKGAIFVTCIGSIGKIGLADREFAFNQQINAIQPNNKVLSKYLAYCMLYNKKSLQAIANASVVPIINKSQFEEFEIEFEENKDKQKQIIEVLDKLTVIMNAKECQLLQLDNLIKARFVELFGDPKSNKNNLVRIEDIGILTSGGTPSRTKSEYFEGKIRWYSAGELNSQYLPDSIEHISEDALKQSAAKLFKKGTLMIGMYDTAAFKMGILTEDSSSNQACANLNPTEEYNVVWLYYLFEIMKPIFLNERQGVRQKNLSLSKIKSFEVPSASIGLQEQFAAFVKQTNKSKVVIKNSLKEFETLKQALMLKYFGN